MPVPPAQDQGSQADPQGVVLKPPEAQPVASEPQAQETYGAPQTQPLPTQPILGDQEAPPGPPFQPLSPTSPQITSEKPEKSKFKIIIIGLLILTAITWGLVASLYFSNVKLREEAEESETSTQEQVSPSPTPTPAPQYETEIINGSVYRVGSNGNEEILINKEDYAGTGITGFVKVATSPDDTKICFESWPPALEPALYYADIDGTGATKVADRVKNCLWSNGSAKVAYINEAAQDSAVDIFVYDILAKEETNLTNVSTASAVFRRYEAVSWSAEDTKVSCTYEEIDTANPAEETLGTCEVDVETGEVTDL